MVRLNAQLINMSAQKHNPVRDWELDLRGYRIPVIENLGATLDQFDTIDFTDNDIRKLDKFPLLKRLKNILLSNNRIVRISEGIEENLPSLETLILTNNGLKELNDIDPLSSVKTLQYLSFLGNPVVTKKNYRLYVIHKIPSLRVLDFCRVKLRERETAAKMFKKKKTQAQAQPTAQPVENGTKARTFTPGGNLSLPKHTPPSGPSKTDVAAIRKAIANAKTLEEIERLNQMLKTGQIPGHGEEKNNTPAVAVPRDERPEEEDEEEEEEEEEEQEQEMEAVAENTPQQQQQEVDEEEEEESDEEDRLQAAAQQQMEEDDDEDTDEYEHEEMEGV